MQRFGGEDVMRCTAVDLERVLQESAVAGALLVPVLLMLSWRRGGGSGGVPARADAA
jgi:hypothetical protein